MKNIILVGCAPLEDKYLAEIGSRRFAHLADEEVKLFQRLMDNQVTDEDMEKIPAMFEKLDNYCLEERELHSADKTDSVMHNAIWSEAAKLRTNGEFITPSAVEYDYKLMFEDRTISLLTYNTETLLAEKVQTIFARGIANTRMRDFYDVYGIVKMNAEKIDKDVLIEAFHATCEKRETVFTKTEITDTLAKIKENEAMAQMWEQFRKKNFFVGDLQWDEVICDVLKTMDVYILMYF